jgi:hypothetical protein
MLHVAPVHHQEHVEHDRILGASFCSLIEISIERAPLKTERQDLDMPLGRC